MKDRTAWIDRAYGTDGARRELEQERFVQEVTAALFSSMLDAGLSQVDVASKLGKTPAFVSQVLSGKRNCTLHTVAEVAWAVGVRLGVESAYLQPLSHPAFLSSSNVISIRRIAIKQGARSDEAPTIRAKENSTDECVQPLEIFA